MLTYNIEVIKADPILKELKNISNIFVDPQNTIVEKAKAIVGYAHNMFEHDGDNLPSSTNPVTILKEARAGKEFRCVEYSLLAQALLWAYGIPARIIGLKTEDVETREYGAGHVVVEFLDSESLHWTMCDVQAGVMFKSDEKYLSTYELMDLKDKTSQITVLKVADSKFGKDGMFSSESVYFDWLREYLFFIDTPTAISFQDRDRSKEEITMLLPEDSNPPIRFQNMFDMNVKYIYNAKEFYPNLLH